MIAPRPAYLKPNSAAGIFGGYARNFDLAYSQKSFLIWSKQHGHYFAENTMHEAEHAVRADVIVRRTGIYLLDQDVEGRLVFHAQQSAAVAMFGLLRCYRDRWPVAKHPIP